MRNMGLAWRFTGLASAVVVAVAAGPAVAATGATGSQPGWRIVSTVGSASSRVGAGDIAVTGAGDAWTSWTCGPCPSGPASQNLLQHWDGQRWSLVGLPAQVRYPTAIAGMQASSAKNLWVFTSKGKAVVYNGSQWAVRDLPGWVERPISGDDVVIASAVFSAADVWAFSVDAASDPTLAGHFDKGSWHKVALPVAPSFVAGLGPHDIWLYGFAKNNGQRTLAHWDGTSWRTVSLPAVAKGAILVPSSPVALGAKSVWLTGEIFGPKAGQVRFEFLHWSGKWATTRIPASVGVVSQIATDGHGGFWLISGGTQASEFVHYAGGHFDAVKIPVKGSLASAPETLAPIPGTQSLWAIGFLQDGSTPEYGEIMKYGR